VEASKNNATIVLRMNIPFKLFGGAV